MSLREMRVTEVMTTEVRHLHPRRERADRHAAAGRPRRRRRPGRRRDRRGGRHAVHRRSHRGGGPRPLPDGGELPRRERRPGPSTTRSSTTRCRRRSGATVGEVMTAEPVTVDIVDIGRGRGHRRCTTTRSPGCRWSTATVTSSGSSPGATSSGPSCRTSARVSRRPRPRDSRADARGTGRRRPRRHRATTSRVLRDLVAPAELCAVVKADGYGHGAIAVGQAALAAGASWLGVALVEEGAVLRKAGIDAPDPAAVRAAAGRHRRRRALRPAAERLQPRRRRRGGRRRRGAQGVVAACTSRSNTGMNRVGAGRDEVARAGQGDRRPARAAARGGVDPLRGGRRARQPVHRRAARPLRRGGGRGRAGRARPADAPRRQHRGRHRAPPQPLRPRPGRHRHLRHQPGAGPRRSGRPAPGAHRSAPRSPS